MSGPVDFVRRHGPDNLGQRATLREVAQWCDWHGNACRVSQATIALGVGLSHRQIQRYFAELIEHKWLERIGRSYNILGVRDHDDAIAWCEHPHCRAEVASPRSHLRVARGSHSLRTARTGTDGPSRMADGFLDASEADTTGPVERAVSRHLRSV